MRKQQGMTLIGMIFTLIVVVFIGLLLLRVVPVYITNYTIVSSINSLNEVKETGSNGLTTEKVRELILNRLYINGIQSLSEKQLKITQVSYNRFRVDLNYSVTRPLMYNMYLLMKFKDSKEVLIGGE